MTLVYASFTTGGSKCILWYSREQDAKQTNERIEGQATDGIDKIFGR